MTKPRKATRAGKKTSAGLASPPPSPPAKPARALPAPPASRTGAAKAAPAHAIKDPAMNPAILKPAVDSDDLAAASNPALGEDLALALLSRRDLAAEVLTALGKNGPLMKYRKVRLELVMHPRTPRHLSLPQIRYLYTFELMQVALAIPAPADVKKAAEDSLSARLESISSGERITLARRASGEVAAALLQDADPRIALAALDNPRLVEAHIVRELLRDKPAEALASLVCHHSKWSLRKDVRAALLRNGFTPLAFAIQLSQDFRTETLAELLRHSRLDARTREYLLQISRRRASRRASK